MLCPNAWDKEAISSDTVRNGHAFLTAGEELLEPIPFYKVLAFDIHRYARSIVEKHRNLAIAGVVGTGDYPGCMLAAQVAKDLGLPGPDPRLITLLSHKFYSREIQQRVVSEATPAFEALDPFSKRPAPAKLAYPFFVKPVKGTMSIRATMVHSPDELKAALRFGLRERAEKLLLLRPFAQLLQRHTDGRVPAHHFVAEAPLSGLQVTVDGFVQNGEVTVMGIVDSVMYPGTISFQRFEYPSRLPEQVQDRMARIARELVGGSGLDHTCFNVEMFYDEASDAVQIIEVNPRMSYQFADLYERVDGQNTFAIQLALAVAEPIRWRPRAGVSGAAASFVMRRFTDARVVSVPTEADLARVRAAFPRTIVRVLCAPGERLSEHDQDVGSFRYCIVNMGAENEAALFASFAEAERMLPFDLVD